MVNKTEYSAWIGVWKSIKNSAWTLIPFFLAVLSNVPIEYAWIASPIAYFCKNYYENKIKK